MNYQTNKKIEIKKKNGGKKYINEKRYSSR